MPSGTRVISSPIESQAGDMGKQTKAYRLFRHPALLVSIILLLGALVRAINLELPPVDYHSWRQTETAALARNYFEEGYRLFYPTVDWRGDTPGYVESELSLYAFTVAVGYGLFGFDESIARLLSIFVTAVTGFLLFLIGQRIWNTRASLLTLIAFTFLSPFGLFFGQAIMGEMTVLLFATLAFYAGMRWSEGASGLWFVLAALSATLGALSKLPAVYIGVPLALLVFQREGWRAVRQPRNWLTVFVVLSVVAGWYLHAYRLGQQTGLTFGILGAGDKTGELKMLLDRGFYRALFRNFTYRLLTTSGVGLWALGMVLPRRKMSEWALYAWVGGVLIYFLYASEGVLHQDYYTLALLPPGALFIGKSLDWIYRRIIAWSSLKSPWCRLAALSLFSIWTVALIQAGSETVQSAIEMFAPLEPAAGTWMVGQWIQAATPAEEGLLVVGSSPPEGLYFSNRHGLWLDEDEVASAGQEGWPFAVILNPYYGGYQAIPEMQKEWRVIGGGQWFLIFDLQQNAPGEPTRTFMDTPQWGKQISLLGYDLRPEWLVDNNLYLVLHWRADQRPSGQYVGFIHAWNDAGTLCGQDDHQVLNGWYGTDQWHAGEIILDPFEVDVSNCQIEDKYRLNVGLYHVNSGERLPLTSWATSDQLHQFDIELLQSLRK